MIKNVSNKIFCHKKCNICLEKNIYLYYKQLFIKYYDYYLWNCFTKNRRFMQIVYIYTPSLSSHKSFLQNINYTSLDLQSSQFHNPSERVHIQDIMFRSQMRNQLFSPNEGEWRPRRWCCWRRWSSRLRGEIYYYPLLINVCLNGGLHSLELMSGTRLPKVVETTF